MERIVVGIESSRGGAMVVVSRRRVSDVGGWVDEALLAGSCLEILILKL